MRDRYFRAYVILDEIPNMIDLSSPSYNEQYFVDGLGRLVWVEETEGGLNLHHFEKLEEDWSLSRAEVSEWTGLFDSNRTRIYEGDILSGDLSSGWVNEEVRYANGTWVTDTSLLGDTCSYRTVVGNIYELLFPPRQTSSE